MTYSLVTHYTQSTTNQNPFTTSAINTTGADLLVVGTSGTAGNITLTDSKGNSWTALTPQDAPFAAEVTIWYAKSAITGTGHTFTANATTSGTNFASILIQAWSGSDPNPIDQTNGATSGFASSIQTGSITPSVNGCIVVTISANNSTANPSTVDSGFTRSDTALTQNSVCNGADFAYLIQTTATAENPTWTFVGGQQTGGVSIASFKPLQGVITSASLTASATMIANFGQQQISSPVADTSNAGSWTQQDGVTTTNLWQQIDEIVASDADFIESPFQPSSSVYTARLNKLGVPLAGQITLSTRMRASGTGGTVNVVIDLMQGVTIIQTFTHNSLSGSGFVTFNDVVTNPISDWSTPLDVRFTATQTS